MCIVFAEAVTRNPLFKDAKEDRVEKIMSDWLKHAKDLDGGRENRRQEVLEERNPDQQEDNI